MRPHFHLQLPQRILEQGEGLVSSHTLKITGQEEMASSYGMARGIETEN